MNTTVLQQIAALPTMETAALNEMWRELHESEPPEYHRSILIRRLSYRLQEVTYGGLSDDIKMQMQQARKAKPDKRRHRDLPPPGTMLIREWKGVEHKVKVLINGFEYQQCKYKSLSEVAKVITGTQWSGPLFFGLRRT